MAGRIPQTFIDELVSRVDIVELVDGYVPLKKAGKDYKARCPFHDEKTASFHVVPDKQFFHCFGCGAHGTAIGFLMDYAHMDFVEAVEELAQRAGLEVPREAGPRREGPDRSAPALEGLARANEFYRAQLRRHPDAARAVEYLKGRGVSGEIAAEYQLGFAPPGWDNLLRALGADDAGRARLAAAGLVAEGERGHFYDWLRDRITFPIHDHRGRVVGFGGRILDAGEPKYLNSPETAVFHKGRELYGLWQARRAGRSLERLYVVEGYMDVVSLAQFGVRNAVATLGTAATEDQIQRLFRAAPDVVFCFDGDDAGRRAAWRALENALPALREGRGAFFMFLPEGEDPDTLIRSRGREGFEAAADAARPLSVFLFDHLSEGVDLDTAEGRARLADAAAPLIAKVPPGAFRRQLGARLAELTGDAQSAAPAAGEGRRRRTPRPAGPAAGVETPVRRAVTLLLHHPALAARAAPDALAGIDVPGADLLRELLALVHENPGIRSSAQVLERYRGHDAEPHLRRLALREVAALDAGLEREFDETLGHIARAPAEHRFAALQERARVGALTEEEREEYRSLVAGFARRPASAEKPGPGTAGDGPDLLD